MRSIRDISYLSAKKARPAYIVGWVWSRLNDDEKNTVLKNLSYTDEFEVYHHHPRWYWIDRIFANVKGKHWRGINEEWIDTFYEAFDQCISKEDLKDWIHDRRRLWMEGKRKQTVKKKRKKKSAAA